MFTMPLRTAGARTVMTLGAAAAVLAALAVPARATVPFSWHQRGYNAIAIWQLGDRYNTYLTIAGSERTDQIQGGKPGPANSVSVDFSQSYCDLAHDMWVDRFASGSADAAASITHNLTAASWKAVPVTLAGTEYRTPLIGHSCDALDYENYQSVDLAPATTTVGANFTASGSMVTSNSVRRESFEGRFFHTVSLGQARLASAVAVRLSSSSPYLTALGTLPAPSFAFIGHDIHTEVTITHGKLRERVDRLL
jgi:hypothetical protein